MVAAPVLPAPHVPPNTLQWLALTLTEGLGPTRRRVFVQLQAVQLHHPGVGDHLDVRRASNERLLYEPVRYGATDADAMDVGAADGVGPGGCDGLPTSAPGVDSAEHAAMRADSPMTAMIDA